MPIVQVDIPVISVGNITTGGTGKTPLVQWIVKHLQQNGRNPAVVLRGYKRASRGLLVVHDGESMIADVKSAGDEAFLHATKLHVPVVVCASKVDAAVHAAGFLPCDVIVVDDGFQHRSLHRDIDVVVVDETPAAKLQLLPSGVLREPTSSLERADVVVRVAVSIDGAYVLGKGPDEGASSPLPEALKNVASEKRLLPVTGIANPSRFVKSLRDATNRTVLEPMEFQDHRWYTKADVTQMIANAQAYDACIVTTEKDAVKLNAYSSQFRDANVDVLVITTSVDVVQGREELCALILKRIINEDSSVESVGQ